MLYYAIGCRENRLNGANVSSIKYGKMMTFTLGRRLTLRIGNEVIKMIVIMKKAKITIIKYIKQFEKKVDGLIGK